MLNTAAGRVFDLRCALLLGLVLVALAGCQRAVEDPAQMAMAQSPEAAVMASVEALRAGDLKALIEAQLPPSEQARLAADWDHWRMRDDPDVDRLPAAMAWLAKLAEPGAEDRLMVELEPRLVEFEAQIAPQLGMYLAMFKALAEGAVAQNATLTEAQRSQASNALQVVAAWASQTTFTDRARLREALGELAQTARGLDVDGIDGLRALSFEDAIARASIGFAGLKRALASYGLSLDELLASVQVQTLSRETARATVEISWSFIGQDHRHTTELAGYQGRWYAIEVVERLQKQQAEAAQQGAVTAR